MYEETMIESIEAVGIWGRIMVLVKEQKKQVKEV